MKFDEPVMEKIFTDVFRPAVAAAGFDLRTLNEEPKAGLIDDRIRVEIRTSRFLIADLTHGNQGAYWEAGYAEGLGKPVFYTCEKSVFDREKTHFDTNHHYTVPWEKDKPGDAAEKLKAAIRATLPQDAKLTDD
jgi:nucleoside 2-deoxyribosyltransferase